MKKNPANINTKGLRYCGVPQCHNLKRNGNEGNIGLFSLPIRVKKNKKLEKEWMHILKMGKPFPKNFKICNTHFKEKYIMKSHLHLPGRKKRMILSTSATPSENLPVCSLDTKLPKKKERRVLTRIIPDPEPEPEINIIEPEIVTPTTFDVETQCDQIITFNKCIQVQLELPIKWVNEKRIKIMTGIPSMAVLNKLTEICERYSERRSTISMRDRICFVMRKLKSNQLYSEVAGEFDLSMSAARDIFANTIDLLAKVMQGLVRWPTQEENKANLPKCFAKFQNVITVLDCTEIKTVAFDCLTCRTSTYSHYKSAHTVKVLVGVTPSGLLNYISKAIAGRSSDKAIFNLTSLLTKLKPGDAVMVDKGFLIRDELEKANITMIRPDFAYNVLDKEQVQHSTRIASARVHVERRIARMKIFRVLADKVRSSDLTYIDDILTVVGALSNLSSPILSEEKF